MSSKEFNKKTGKVEYKQFDIQATVQSIWAEQDLAVKKKRLIDEVVNNFQFKDKIAKFTFAVNNARSSKEIDKILTNIVLMGEGLSSLKL